jgi:hypothetical protein
VARQRVATPAHVRGSALNAISCSSARWCVAVGYERTADGRQRLLAEVNTGAAWRRVTAPTPNGLYAEFTNVSCVPHRETCFAIANTRRGGNVQPFIAVYHSPRGATGIGRGRVLTDRGAWWIAAD